MIINSISFNGGGYHSPLKALFKEGRLPTVTRGFYGGNISPNNVSLEHLKPASQGGRTVLNNLVLASKWRNMIRGTKKLSHVIDPRAAIIYLEQFRDINVGWFNGNEYIRMIAKKLSDMHIHLDKFGFNVGQKTKPSHRFSSRRCK